MTRRHFILISFSFLWAPQIFSIHFTREILNQIPRTCLRDLYCTQPLSASCTKGILQVFKQNHITPPKSFKLENHKPFQTDCSCGFCSFRSFLEETLKNESIILQTYFRGEKWRRRLILDGSLTNEDGHHLHEHIHDMFRSTKNLELYNSGNPTEYWEAFLTYSKQERWVARFGLLEEKDPHLQRLHPANQPHLIEAIRIVRMKVRSMLAFSQQLNWLRTPNTSTLTSIEKKFHTFFKQTTESHYERTTNLTPQKKREKYRRLLDLATQHENRYKNQHETLRTKFLKDLASEEKEELITEIESIGFQKNLETLKVLGHNLYDTFQIQKFCYKWVKKVRYLAKKLHVEGGADSTTPLSVLLMSAIDDPYISALFLTLEDTPGAPFFDGWDYYITLLASSILGLQDQTDL